jgi:flagellar biosynthesis/type III secretory pathway protein FliH
MCDVMSFPATVDEFMEQYKIVDREEVYTNGADPVPIFRMKQWFEHEAQKKAPTALDHIHNVVAENSFNKGYDEGYKEGYERGQKDLATSLARRITARFDMVLGVDDVLEEIDNLLEEAAKGE